MWIYGIGLVIIIILIYIIYTNNTFIKYKNRVDEAFSTMDVYLKKRYDLIPSIVEVVKSYSKHESETLEQVTKLRNKTYNNMTFNDKLSTNLEIEKEISKLMVVVEGYPELKANQNYLDLSKKLVNIEDDIANSRKYYNAVVREYNNLVSMFPSLIIANIFGYKSSKMFEANQNERETVKVELQ